MIKAKRAARASDLAASLLELKGHKLRFDGYECFRKVYDIDPDIMVLKAGRQIGKSVSLGGRLVSKSIARKHFNSLYIAPFQIQAKRFSNAYLDAFMASPLVKKYFRKSSDIRNVYEKRFSNGSAIYLSYAQTESDADRIRGLMADLLTVDEAQDISMEALPPIFEILNASNYNLKVISGTSKSTSNTLEQYWLKTNQCEWAMKCPHCNHYVIPSDYDTCLKICQSPVGPICDKCGKPIDVEKGQWVATRSTIGMTRVGFHLPQIIVGENTKPKKWKNLYYEKVMSAMNGGLYTANTLANEVFGLATDLSGKSLSAKEAMSCCHPEITTWFEPYGSARNTMLMNSILASIQHIVIGVDWSCTGSEKSFTVASVLGFDYNGKCFLLESRKMQGIHILEQVSAICDLARKWNANMIGSDRGVGVLQGQLMQKELGVDKVIMINYVSAAKRLRWDMNGQFLAADRTQGIDNVMMKWRTGMDRFLCPTYDLTESFWRDALSVFEEESAIGKRLYRHHPDEPDDWMHSVVFGNIAYQYLSRDFSFTE